MGRKSNLTKHIEKIITCEFCDWKNIDGKKCLNKLEEEWMEHKEKNHAEELKKLRRFEI